MNTQEFANLIVNCQNQTDQIRNICEMLGLDIWEETHKHFESLWSKKRDCQQWLDLMVDKKPIEDIESVQSMLKVIDCDLDIIQEFAKLREPKRYRRNVTITEIRNDLRDSRLKL